MKLLCTGGRYPDARTAAPHHRMAIAGRIQVQGDALVFRIDDVMHPERWEEFCVGKKEFLHWLMQFNQEA